MSNPVIINWCGDNAPCNPCKPGPPGLPPPGLGTPGFPPSQDYVVYIHCGQYDKNNHTSYENEGYKYYWHQGSAVTIGPGDGPWFSAPLAFEPWGAQVFEVSVVIMYPFNSVTGTVPDQVNAADADAVAKYISGAP